MPQRSELTCARRRCGSRPAIVAGAVMLLACVAARADNAALQNLFFDACAGAAGALSERCAETTGGLGDLSSDSESSLNPSQALSGTASAHSMARERSERARERGERLLDHEQAATGGGLDLGPFSLLVNGHGLSEDRDRTVDVDSERGYELDTWGAQIGLDYRFAPGLVAGALVTWETSDLDFDREAPGVNFTPQGRAGTVEQDSLGVTVFANLQVGERGYVDLSGGYIDSDYTLDRRAIFQESQRLVPQTLTRTRATPDGEEVWAAVAAGYAARAGGWSIDPHLGVTYSRAKIDGYRERDVSGTGLAMAVNDLTSRSVLGQVGVRFTRAISRPGYVLLPQFNAEYVREFERDGPTTRVSYLLDQAGNSLALEADRRDRDFLDVGVGLVLLLPNGWMPFLEYETTLGLDDVDRRRISLGLRVEL